MIINIFFHSFLFFGVFWSRWLARGQARQMGDGGGRQGLVPLTATAGRTLLNRIILKTHQMLFDCGQLETDCIAITDDHNLNVLMLSPNIKHFFSFFLVFFFLSNLSNFTQISFSISKLCTNPDSTFCKVECNRSTKTYMSTNWRSIGKKKLEVCRSTNGDL